MGTIDGLSNYSKLNLEKVQYYDETDMLEALDDGIQLYEGLCQMDPNIFNASKICHDEDDPYQAYKNY